MFGRSCLEAAATFKSTLGFSNAAIQLELEMARPGFFWMLQAILNVTSLLLLSKLSAIYFHSLMLLLIATLAVLCESLSINKASSHFYLSMLKRQLFADSLARTELSQAPASSFLLQLICVAMVVACSILEENQYKVR